MPSAPALPITKNESPAREAKLRFGIHDLELRRWDEDAAPETRRTEILAAAELGETLRNVDVRFYVHCVLTPELSRPTAGRRQRASVAHSTLLTPRCGVGLNDLLGGKEAGVDETIANLPKTEAGTPERAPENFQLDLSEVTV